MSKVLKEESYFLNYNGVTLKYTFRWWMPFKKLWLKIVLLLADHMELIYTYDAQQGTTGSVQNRIWSKEKRVEFKCPGHKYRGVAASKENK